MNDRKRLLELCLEYELGTLEGDEAREVQELLSRNDPAVHEVLSEARATVAALGLTAPEASPPAAVKTRLMAAVAAQPPRRATSPEPLAAGPEQRTSLMSWTGWAIAAGLLFTVFFGWRNADRLQTELTDSETRLEQLEADRNRLAQDVEQYQRVLRILSGPETRAVALTASGNPRMHAYWNQQLGMVLAGSDLPAPAPDRTLQLWIVPKQGSPVSVDVFRPAADGGALVIASPDFTIADAAALAVSEEPAGGSPAPTTTPIWVGPIG